MQARRSSNPKPPQSSSRHTSTVAPAATTATTPIKPTLISRNASNETLLATSPSTAFLATPRTVTAPLGTSPSTSSFAPSGGGGGGPLTDDSRRAAMLLRNVTASDFPTSFESFQTQFLIDQYQRAKKAEGQAAGEGGGGARRSVAASSNAASSTADFTTDPQLQLQQSAVPVGSKGKSGTGGKATSPAPPTAAAAATAPPTRRGAKRKEAELRIENLPSVLAPITVLLPPSPTKSLASDDGIHHAPPAAHLGTPRHSHGNTPSTGSFSQLPSRSGTPTAASTHTTESPVPLNINRRRDSQQQYDGSRHSSRSPEPHMPPFTDSSIAGGTTTTRLSYVPTRPPKTPPPLVSLQYPGGGIQQVALTHLYKKACRQVSNRLVHFTRHSAALRIQRWIRAIWFLEFCRIIRFRDVWSKHHVRGFAQMFVRKGARMAKRTRLRRQQSKERSELEVVCALTLQRAWRCYAAKKLRRNLQVLTERTKQLEATQARQWAAAVRIQNTVRRWLCVKATRLARSSRKNWRLWRVEDRVHRYVYQFRRRGMKEKTHEREEANAATIQRAWRAYKGAKEHATLRDWERLKRGK